ncbi:uncharacterized protein LOC135844937 [Planococcus citri]|uniref:uncharacterized protein LOC135844937 n=1 Tax=Planococcus citri TaxID=170843 RepID=UPI0031F747E0
MCLSFIVIFSLTFFVSQADDSGLPQVEVIHDPSGVDVFCLFSFSRFSKSSTFTKLVPNAKRIGVARLPHHRLDFNYYSKEAKGSLSTPLPDCGYEVWGAIYHIPIQDYDLVDKVGGIVNNERAFILVPKTIEAYIDGNTETYVNMKCVSFEQLYLPEKLIYGLPLPENRRPSKLVLDRMVDAFIDAGLPEKYIEEISQLPIRSTDDSSSVNQSKQN